MSSELKTKWNNLKTKLSVDFSDNEIIDLDSIIFLIGIQELGQFQKRFNKQKKLEVIHIAVCKLLSDYGYYEFDYKDTWSADTGQSRQSHRGSRGHTERRLVWPCRGP